MVENKKERKISEEKGLLAALATPYTGPGVLYLRFLV
jgi:hypothetical protein